MSTLNYQSYPQHLELFWRVGEVVVFLQHRGVLLWVEVGAYNLRCVIFAQNRGVFIRR